jgi:hypothetical protein
MESGLLKSTLASYLKNIPGWRTRRKIVVIESDDWGSIRMPSGEVYEKCLEAGYRVDRIAYERYDSLASEADLERLFELLLSFRDIQGNPPVITANVLPANPDFEKIKESGYREYHYELITETFQRYPEHKRCFQLWKDGMNDGIFFPQSHGREHLNVSLFMEGLRNGDPDLLFGFEHGIPGIIPHGENPAGGNRYVESLKYSTPRDKNDKLEIVLEGLELFENLFGFRSESFIPPNYLWSSEFDALVSDQGVRFYQGNRKMKEPQPDGTVRYHTHLLGDINDHGQRYIVRNVLFEPSLFKMNISDPVANCLRQISAAFTLQKPAVICSHRINYTGFIDPGNRDRNLVLFRELLSQIQKKWPDVEFMNTVQLGNLIEETS